MSLKLRKNQRSTREGRSGSGRRPAALPGLLRSMESISFKRVNCDCCPLMITRIKNKIAEKQNNRRASSSSRTGPRWSLSNQSIASHDVTGQCWIIKATIKANSRSLLGRGTENQYHHFVAGRKKQSSQAVAVSDMTSTSHLRKFQLFSRTSQFRWMD